MVLFASRSNDPSDGAPAEVWLITGFLGSGKTTLLREMVAQAAPGDLALIMNEFADIGIDQALLPADDDLVLVEGGCLCCTAKDDLIDALHRLRADRKRPGGPRFRHLAIETTGLADPNPVVHALRNDRRLSRDFRLAAVVTVVDATSAWDRLETFDEAARQVAAADHLLLSKCDCVLPEELLVLRERLAQLNPLATQRATNRGRPVDFDSGEPRALEPVTRSALIHPWLASEPSRHTSGISSHVIECADPLDWNAFSDWLQGLCLARGRDLLRVKGVVYVAGEASARLINAVNFCIYPTETVELEQRPTDRVSRLVLIGRDLNPSALRRTLDAARRGARGTALA